jgi:hypothetical protein
MRHHIDRNLFLICGLIASLVFALYSVGVLR